MKETPDQGFMFLLLLPSLLEVKDENGDRVGAGSGHSSRCFIHLLPFRMTCLIFFSLPLTVLIASHFLFWNLFYPRT